MLSRVLIKKQKGRRWLSLLAVAGLLTMTMGISGSVLAVHDEEFQLDGDTSPGTAPSVPDPTVQDQDWESLFSSTGGLTGIDTDAATGFNDGTFTRDFRSKATRNGDCTADAALSSSGLIFCTNDVTTFATGSKDSLDITEWQCNRDNNVNSKIDIMNAYAAQYIDPVTGDQIMYFGLDKNKDNGNNNVAFWFLQGDTSCVSAGGAENFSGSGHVDGDVLIVSAFTNGGGVGNIDAYRWDGTDGCIDNPANAATCDGLAIGSGGDCKAASGLDDICATVNGGLEEENDAITTSWLTSDGTIGVGHTVVPPDFFEGGINMTEVFSGSGGASAPSCFATFIADTRSSQSLTATLFDFARGQLGGCETSISTDAAGIGGDGSIGTGSVSSGTDTTTLTVEGTDTWAGTLAWYLCGPDDGLTTCDPDDGVEVTSRTVDQDSEAADFVSGEATLTSAGHYCWSSVFTPDAETAAAGVDGATDDGTDECFDVDPVTPTLTTDASCTSDPCVLGVDTISDSAELSGTAAQPGSGGPSTTYPTINPATPGDPAGGSITWKLYAPGDCDSGTALVDTSRGVSGDGTYPTGLQTAVSYTPLVSDGIGDYVWVASYPGSGPNTNAATTTGCDDEDETVTLIGTAGSSSQQRWLPNDTVTLTSNGGALDGTLTVTLYEGTFTVTDGVCAPDETATAVTGQEYTFDTTGDATGSTYDTSNATFLVDTSNDGDYFWLVQYDDANFTDPADHCESTSITVTD